MIRKFSCFYQILGVSTKASKAEIKQAFYNLAKIHHPDQAKNESGEFNKFKEAYEVLINDDKRYNYDLTKGYLNALDIDDMETNLKQYGSRYVNNLSNSFEQLDLALKNTFSQASKTQKTPVFNEMWTLRVKFAVCLISGFAITYNGLIFVIENYVYSTNPTVDSIKIKLTNNYR